MFLVDKVWVVPAGIFKGEMELSVKKTGERKAKTKKNRWKFPPVLNFMLKGLEFCLTGV
jgi:hypothetical protein